MRRSVLIQGLIGLFPTQLSEPWFAFVTEMRYAVISYVLFGFVVFVALPLLCHR